MNLESRGLIEDTTEGSHEIVCWSLNVYILEMPFQAIFPE